MCAVEDSSGEVGSEPGSEDVWDECTDAEGNIYFFNARTEQSAWERPEGVTIRGLKSGKKNNAMLYWMLKMKI